LAPSRGGTGVRAARRVGSSRGVLAVSASPSSGDFGGSAVAAAAALGRGFGAGFGSWSPSAFLVLALGPVIGACGLILALPGPAPAR
jgi:hypothetical protein